MSCSLSACWFVAQILTAVSYLIPALSGSGITLLVGSVFALLLPGRSRFSVGQFGVYRSTANLSDVERDLGPLSAVHRPYLPAQT